MLKIRLSRVGKKNHPTFRIIISEKQKDTKGDFLELLGSYDPHVSPPAVKIKADRISYWLSQGAQPSSTVHNLLVDQHVISGTKVTVIRAKKKTAEDKASTPTPSGSTPVPAPEAAKTEAEKPKDGKPA